VAPPVRLLAPPVRLLPPSCFTISNLSILPYTFLNYLLGSTSNAALGWAIIVIVSIITGLCIWCRCYKKTPAPVVIKQAAQPQTVVYAQPVQQQQVVYAQPGQQQQVVNAQPGQQQQGVYILPVEQQQVVTEQPVQPVKNAVRFADPPMDMAVVAPAGAGQCGSCGVTSPLASRFCAGCGCGL
jgi:hypothetical protein